MQNYHRALERAGRLAQDVAGVLLAVSPTYPATCYGYIETGQEIHPHEACFEIASFEEKPPSSKAVEFLKTQRYFWNPGISVWKISKLLSLIREHTPEHFSALHYVAEAIGTAELRDRCIEIFRALDGPSIDNAIFEKSAGLAAMPVDLDWNDIGSWSAVYDVQSQGDGNVTRGLTVSIDTKKSLIVSQKRLIATLGVSDLVIVETEDAVLIAHKDETHRLKELYDAVREFGGTKYL